jgi:ribonuclease D
MMSNRSPVTLVDGDITLALEETAYRTGRIALDCETTGLDWRTASLATVQVTADAEAVELVRINSAPPKRLLVLLEDPAVTKVFHHALFDLRFIAGNYDCAPTSVVCTKIAAKLVSGRSDQSSSLKPLVERHLGIRLDKTLQVSDWLGELTSGQLQYAAEDVVHLFDLLESLTSELQAQGLAGLADACYTHIPTRLQLDLLDFPDVFAY